MNQHFIVPVASQLWWVGLALSFVFIMSILAIGRYVQHGGSEKTFRKILVLIFTLRVVYFYFHLYLQGDFKFTESMPLHLCGFSAILAVIYLIQPTLFLFEFLVLLSAAGGLLSILTPEITHAYSHYIFIDYYLEHASLIAVPLYGMMILKHYPRSGAWLKVLIAGNVFLILIAILNYVSGANYMYLCVPPAVDNPLVIGPFPYHILGFEIAGILIVVSMNYLIRKVYKIKAV